MWPLTPYHNAINYTAPNYETKDGESRGAGGVQGACHQQRVGAPNEKLKKIIQILNIRILLIQQSLHHIHYQMD